MRGIDKGNRDAREMTQELSSIRQPSPAGSDDYLSGSFVLPLCPQHVEG